MATWIMVSLGRRETDFGFLVPELQCSKIVRMLHGTDGTVYEMVQLPHLHVSLRLGKPCLHL